MTPPPSDTNASGTSRSSDQDDNFFVVGIGASAGGIEALQTFFDHVSDESGMAFVVVQHMDPTHESELPSILQRHTQLPVMHVEDQTDVAPGHVYIVPPGKSLSIDNRTLRLAEPEQSRQERAPIDLLFRLLAESQGERAVGIVLSGTGSSGATGLQAIHEAGGFTLVQDPSDAEYPGMPRHARATGIADAVLPVADLAERLVQLRRTAPQIQLPRRPEALSAGEHDALDGNADAHLRSSLLGRSVSIPIRDGALALGTWQSVLLIECDGPRERSLSVTAVPAASAVDD